MDDVAKGREERGNRVWMGVLVVVHRSDRVSRADTRYPRFYRASLMRAVNSCTRLYRERSSRMRRVIFELA